MQDLGRINLLVGPNNCGKTTVLEAIDLLADYPDPVALGIRCFERGGLILGEDSMKENPGTLALRHLFHGHQAKPGTQLTIQGHTPSGIHLLTAALADEPGNSIVLNARPAKIKDVAWLQIQWTRPPEAAVAHSVQVSNQGDWPWPDMTDRSSRVEQNFHIPHLSVNARSPAFVAKRLSAVALNPEEGMVLAILRLLEPRLEGIVATPGIGKLGSRDNRSGIYVKLAGMRERIPIAALGEGMWRLLGLALALVDARDSLLLVDEIDVGLHYSVQPAMWQMVKKTAEDLNVQVFATTHSRDCVDALAKIVRPEVTEGSQVTIQRIEGERAVPYSEREISLAAERGIEVR